MHRLYILVLFVLLSLTLTAQNEQVHSADSTGWLSLVTKPENGADIYLNDFMIGKTPFYKKFAFGKYSFRFSNEMYYDTVVEVIVNKDITSYSVDMRPKYGYAHLQSYPKSAIVLIDGEKTGLKTPCVTNKILSGSHDFTFFAEDYYPYNETVIIEDGKIADLDVRFPDSLRIEKNIIDSFANEKALAYKEMYEKYYKKKSNSNYTNYYHEQKNEGFRFGVAGGMNYSTIFGNDVSKSYEWDYNPLFGVTAEYLFNDNWAFSLDIIYTKLAYSHDYQYYQFSVKTENIFQNISLPIMFKYYFNNKHTGFNFDFGFQINYCIDGEYISIVDEVEKLRKFYDATNFLFDLVGGISYDIPIGKYLIINAGARYNYSITSLYKNFNAKFEFVTGFVGMKWVYGGYEHY